MPVRNATTEHVHTASVDGRALGSSVGLDRSAGEDP
jgi:hypothetical protein